MNTDRIVLTPTEAAAMLGISTRTLRDRKRRGLIAWCAYGRRGVGYRESDVIAARDAAVQRASSRQTAPTPIARGQQPEWLVRKIASGEINKLTGRRFGQVAQ